MQGVDGPKTAHTVLILADIMQAQGRYKDAQRLAEIALDILVRGGVDSAVHAEAYQRIAVAQASQGRWADAMASYDKLKAAVAKDEIARRRYLDTNLDLAVALVRGGQAEQAIPILEGVVKHKTNSGEREYAVAEATGFLGAAQAAAGRHGDAMRTFGSVIPMLLTTVNTAAKEEGQVDQDQRRQMIVDAYFVLLTKVRGTELEKSLRIDAADEAFRMADVARAKTVHSAIAASSARAASSDSALNELIRQTQDTDQQLAAMSDMLKSILDGAADQQDQKALQQLRGDIAKLQQARKTLRSEIERQFPQYAQLVNPKPVGIAEARAKLTDGDALIASYFTGGNGYVWAIPKQGDVAFARNGGIRSRDRAAGRPGAQVGQFGRCLDQRNSAIRRCGGAQAARRADGAGGERLARRQEYHRGSAWHARPAAVLAACHQGRWRSRRSGRTRRVLPATATSRSLFATRP